jgi:hypothetical protein
MKNSEGSSLDALIRLVTVMPDAVSQRKVACEHLEDPVASGSIS